MSGAPRLTAAKLAALPAFVRRPAYDRAALMVGHAHIGVGAFHRCHQAEYVEDMLEARFGPWGVTGINLHPPRIADTLAAQDGLYTRTLRQDARSETRLIGCHLGMVEATDAASAHAAIETLASSAIKVVTMTVTEKGYCLTPASGELDRANADLRADLAGGEPSRTVLGLLTLALERRRQIGSGPITLVSCDNIPANSKRLRAGLTGFAAGRNPALASWIERNVAFPCAMVDRIVPASAPDDLDAVEAAIGLRDEAAVFGEPFRQWVVEDRFASERPPWDLAGAQFVADAEPYEHIKMRVLNAAQSTLSHWGALVGFDFSWQAAADPAMFALVERMLATETAPTLPRVEGMEVGAYIATSLSRIRNTAIRHRCHQIGTDGSQKIVQRLIAPLRACRARGRAAPGLERALAGWIAYVAAGAKRHGARWTPSDPFAADIIARADATGDFGDLARAVLAITNIFGDDLQEEELAQRLGGHLAGLLGPDPAGYLRRALSDG
jgi:fructuronate reductase